ncbi:MAG: DUF1848 domain-containing protein [Candidatus Riflebacteria bacterium]|nr:DUF1848 domain-containing protein [Candidatus Riflebacteria bacterium]
MTKLTRILSVSRRTDIPRFYTDWFLNRIKAGFVNWKNPFNQKVTSIYLNPDEFKILVFWTRDPQKIYKNLDFLCTSGYFPFFHVTLTGFGLPLETYPVQKDQVIRSINCLSEKLSPQRVIWRYDPIIVSEHFNENWHLQNFEKIARELSGSVKMCYFSFVDCYSKTIRNLSKNGIKTIEPGCTMKKVLSHSLAEIAEKYGITMFSCCENDLESERIKRGHCIDAPFLNDLLNLSKTCSQDQEIPKISGNFQIDSKPAPTREGCGCWRSVDIGSYNTCAGGCLYCYATSNHLAADKYFLEHDSMRDSL